jgi:hypothetical protein
VKKLNRAERRRDKEANTIINLPARAETKPPLAYRVVGGDKLAPGQYNVTQTIRREGDRLIVKLTPVSTWTSKDGAS